MLNITPNVTSLNKTGSVTLNGAITLTGTANQVVLVQSGQDITFSTPQSIATGSSPTFTGLTLSGMTAGSVLFAGTSGVVTQDNANFFWDDTNNRLGLGVADPIYRLSISDGFAKTDTTLRVDTFFQSNEAQGGFPWGMYIGLTGAAAIGNRYITLQTAEFNVANGGNILLQPNGGNVGIGTNVVPTALLSIAEKTLVDSNGLMSKYNNIALTGWGVPAIHDTQSLTNQGADIADTNFANGGVAGLYRVNYYLLDTTADLTAGTVTINIKWNDGTGARSVTGQILLTATTSFVNGVAYVRLGSGNVTYGTTHTGVFGSSKYALYLSFERLA